MNSLITTSRPPLRQQPPGACCFFAGVGRGTLHGASMPCWTRPGFLVCWRWHFVVSAVRAELNRQGRSFVWAFCQSPEPLCLWLHLPPIWKTLLLFLHPPNPLCVSEELPPPPLSTPSIWTPFCRAGFYWYLAGDWQLTFCTGRNFWEQGQYQWVSCLSPSFWDSSIHLCISPLICLSEQPSSATRHLSFRPSLPVWSSSQGWIFGQASTSFHFQLQQTERLH